MMTEETQFDEVITCDHSYDKRCHTSYVTTFEAQQEEECEENFKKVCMIEYESKAYNETLEICSTEIVKDCDKEGPTVCRTVYQSSCATRNIEHEVCQSSPSPSPLSSPLHILFEGGGRRHQLQDGADGEVPGSDGGLHHQGPVR